jgi:thiosulfate/3-mercaptopyruvate sulfurtransferase
MNGPLVSVAGLADLMASTDGERLVVLDVRWSLTGPPGRELYEAGHLPGARFVDLDHDLADPPGAAGRHPLPEPARFAALVRAAMDGTSAARAWWLLRYHGHVATRLLDGGIGAWQAAGRPVTREPATVVPGDFVVRPGRLPVIDADGAAELAASGVLLDARAVERYRGEVEPVDPVAGHIPGAVSAPTVANVRADGRLRTAAELRDRFAALGVRDGIPIGVYCGSGVTAAHEVLALDVAGLAAALYPGSWSEWIALGRPVATGGQP